MKTYVIKNKEGKYWQWLFNHESEWEEKLYTAFLHYSKEDAERSIISWQLEDCEVVSITIAEGDLEHKFEVYKEALKLACETIRKIMPDKPMYICGQAIADRLGIPMTSQIKDYEYFIEQAEESINDNKRTT